MHSVLNPEAPEFYPHITSLTQDHASNMNPFTESWAHFDQTSVNENAYKTIRRTVMSSNAFPSGESYDFFKTFTDFNIVTCQLSENVVVKSNKIVISEMPAVKLKKHEVEYNTEIILDTNNKVLDRIEIKMDSLKKGHTANTEALEDARFAGHNVAPWNYSPVLKKIQVGSTTFLGAKNIPRPQLTFKDPVDNTDSLWVPKISDKPNNIKPLALNIIYNDRGEAVGYEHPYKVELELYEPPPEFLAPAAEPLSFPPPMDQTAYTYIDTESKVDELVEHLNTVKEIAVDVEHHSYRTYQGITCLIQISTDQGGDFIIDALAVREHIHKLNLSFTDPRKLKVFHGADMDVLWLQRDFGVYIVGLFDTYRAARSLRTPGLALKNLLKHYCDVEVDKKYQLADWRIRPLPAELVEYARQDTHYLLYVWRRMRAELLAAGGGHNLLRAIFHRSKVICAATYNKMVMDDTSHLGLYVRSRRVFNSRQMAALKMLYRWRDEQARLLDESVTYLIPNHMMLALAESLPREVQGVNACCNPMPPFVKQNIIKIHRMLLSCREMPLEPMPQPGEASVERGYLAPATSAYDVHDLALDDFPKLMREDDIILDQTNDLLNDENEINIGQVQVTAITPEEEKEEKINFVSNLNVQAKTYVPPYNRYRGSRHLAKEEEMRDMKSKEAKITAIAQGDQLIKAELLLKLQESKKLIENEQKNEDNVVKDNEDGEQSSQKKTVQRKRKMSTEKAENKSESNASQVVVKQLDISSKKDNESKAHDSSDKHNFKPYNYNNVNFMKYRHECDKSRKEPKMKFKKHK